MSREKLNNKLEFRATRCQIDSRNNEKWMRKETSQTGFCKLTGALPSEDVTYQLEAQKIMYGLTCIEGLPRLVCGEFGGV